MTITEIAKTIAAEQEAAAQAWLENYMAREQAQYELDMAKSQCYALNIDAQAFIERFNAYNA